MRLPAPRERRRSTVLGEPFLRAVSTGAKPETSETEPPQVAETSGPQPLDPFRAMVNLFNACQQADAEIAEIEETLARDPDALPPEAIVAPAQKLLAQTQSDIERLPPGKASEHVIRTAQREGLAVSGRVLEADARARQRFTTGAISDAADRLAARVSENPATLKPSLEMLNDLIETADLDPSDKRLIKANLESRVRRAAEPPDESPDASASATQMSSSGTVDLEQVARDGKSDALTPPSGAGDAVEIAPQRDPGLFEISPEAAEQIASKIRKLQAAMNADRGDGKSLVDAQEEFANQVDRLIENQLRKRFGERTVTRRDAFNAVFERGYRELRQWLHGEIDRIGEENGYSDRHIANLKLMADTTVVTISIIGPGGRRGRGGGDGDPDGRDDPEAPENEQRDRDQDDAGDEGQFEDDGDGRRDERAEDRSRPLSVEELRQRSANDAGSFTGEKFASEEDYLEYRRIVHSGVPRGFRDKEHFGTVGEKLFEELAGGDGFENARFAIRGSAVTSKKFDRNTERYEGRLFDTGKELSDFDLAVVDGNLMNRAFKLQKLLRIRIRQSDTRTPPLNARQLRGLGLNHLAEEVEQLAKRTKRKVEIMIYKNDQALWERGQAMWLPRGE